MSFRAGFRHASSEARKPRFDYRARRAHARAIAIAPSQPSSPTARSRCAAPSTGISNRFSHGRQLPPAILEILRLATYELVYTRADVHATVFEFVNLAKRWGHRGLANLVNAVLRSLLRAEPMEPRREPLRATTSISERATRCRPGSCASGARSSADALEAICGPSTNPRARRSWSTRSRTRRRKRRSVFARAESRTQPSPYVPEVLLVERGPASRVNRRRRVVAAIGKLGNAGRRAGTATRRKRSSTFAAGAEIRRCKSEHGLPDQGSSLVHRARCAQESRVLERRLEEAGVVAAVVDGRRCARGTAARVSVSIAYSWTHPAPGVGVVGRHPEARWKKQGTDGERLALTQRALLEQMARHVHAGGALVYAVCSTDPRETTEVIDWFLARQNFERGLIPSAYRSLLDPRRRRARAARHRRPRRILHRARRAPRVSFLAKIEQFCASFIERAFAKTFPSDLEPAQIARKLVSTMEAQTRDDEGRLRAPGSVRRLREPRRFRPSRRASRVPRARVGRPLARPRGEGRRYV